MSKLRTTQSVWHWPKLRKKIRATVEKRLLYCGEMARSRLVENLSLGYTRVDGPSAPGDFPHRDTGRLAQSYRVIPRFLPTAAEVIVGSDLKYAFWLEHGTAMMAARPHLAVTVAQLMPLIRRIMTAKIK